MLLLGIEGGWKAGPWLLTWAGKLPSLIWLIGGTGLRVNLTCARTCVCIKTNYSDQKKEQISLDFPYMPFSYFLPSSWGFPLNFYLSQLHKKNPQNIRSTTDCISAWSTCSLPSSRAVSPACWDQKGFFAVQGLVLHWPLIITVIKKINNINHKQFTIVLNIECCNSVQLFCAFSTKSGILPLYV